MNTTLGIICEALTKMISVHAAREILLLVVVGFFAGLNFILLLLRPMALLIAPALFSIRVE